MFLDFKAEYKQPQISLINFPNNFQELNMDHSFHITKTSIRKSYKTKRKNKRKYRITFCNAKYNQTKHSNETIISQQVFRTQDVHPR